MSIYKGFSTLEKNKKFKITDFELVKRDILNHFYIRRGEKLMNPKFGSIIWEVLFDQLTDDVRKTITDDVKRIVGYEMRVELNAITVTEFEHGIQLELDLTFLTTNQTDVIKLRFDRESSSLTIL
jgi:phage baseplate assembly protein W